METESRTLYSAQTCACAAFEIPTSIFVIFVRFVVGIIDGE